MRLLAIETSGSVGSVAVLEPGKVSEYIAFPEGTRNAVSLVPSINLLLEKVGWRHDVLDAVAVSIGPGSYTGLRIGLVCAKILAGYARTDFVAVPTLDVVAANVSPEAKFVCAVMDARRGQVYSASYERAGGVLRRWTGYAVAAPGEIAGTLRERSHVIGDGIPILRPAIEGLAVRLAPEDNWLPKADGVAEVGGRLYEGGQRDDPYSTEPMYLRKSYAEEK